MYRVGETRPALVPCFAVSELVERLISLPSETQYSATFVLALILDFPLPGSISFCIRTIGNLGLF